MAKSTPLASFRNVAIPGLNANPGLATTGINAVNTGLAGFKDIAKSFQDSQNKQQALTQSLALDNLKNLATDTLGGTNAANTLQDYQGNLNQFLLDNQNITNNIGQTDINSFRKSFENQLINRRDTQEKRSVTLADAAFKKVSRDRQLADFARQDIVTQGNIDFNNYYNDQISLRKAAQQKFINNGSSTKGLSTAEINSLNPNNFAADLRNKGLAFNADPSVINGRVNIFSTNQTQNIQTPAQALQTQRLAKQEAARLARVQQYQAYTDKLTYKRITTADDQSILKPQDFGQFITNLSNTYNGGDPLAKTSVNGIQSIVRRLGKKHYTQDEVLNAIQVGPNFEPTNIWLGFLHDNGDVASTKSIEDTILRQRVVRAKAAAERDRLLAPIKAFIASGNPSALAGASLNSNTVTLPGSNATGSLGGSDAGAPDQGGGGGSATDKSVADLQSLASNVSGTPITPVQSSGNGTPLLATNPVSASKPGIPSPFAPDGFGAAAATFNAPIPKVTFDSRANVKTLLTNRISANKKEQAQATKDISRLRTSLISNAGSATSKANASEQLRTSVDRLKKLKNEQSHLISRNDKVDKLTFNEKVRLNFIYDFTGTGIDRQNFENGLSPSQRAAYDIARNPATPKEEARRIMKALRAGKTPITNAN